MVNEIKTFEERKEELVKLGKEKGFITYEELANKLKGLDLDGDSLDDLYNVFNENSIAVVSEEESDSGAGSAHGRSGNGCGGQEQAVLSEAGCGNADGRADLPLSEAQSCHAGGKGAVAAAVLQG